MLHKEFVPHAESYELKELGFDEPCFGWYLLAGGGTKQMVIDEKCPKQEVGLCLAPTFSQAFRFFRDKYELNHEIPYAGKKGEYHAFVNSYIHGNNGNSPSVFPYDDAELTCLKKLIEIVKNK